MGNNVTDEVIQDEAAVAGQQGTPTLGVVNEAHENLVDADGDNNRPAMDRKGTQYVHEVSRTLIDEAVSIPSGPAVTIHPERNVEPNAFDMGWLYVEGLHSQLANIKVDGSLDVYLLNAPDNQGTGFTGGDFAFGPTEAGVPFPRGAMIFPNFFRVVLVNTSGATVTGHVTSTGYGQPLGDFVSSFGDDVLPFIPATHHKSGTFVQSPSGTFKPLSARDSALGQAANVAVTEIDRPVDVAPVSGRKTTNVVVGSTPVLLDPVKLPGRTSITVINEDEDQSIRIGEGPLVSQINQLLGPKWADTQELGEADDTYAVIKGGGTVESIVDKMGSSAAGTATDVNNALVDDTARAVIDADGETIEITGLSGAGLNNIADIRLACKARKSSTPASETSAFGDVTPGIAGNVLSVSSATVTAQTGRSYYAFVSRRNNASKVINVTGMGLSWAQAVPDAIGGQSRASCFVASGTPTNGPVTATFDVLPTNATIHVVGIDDAGAVQSIEPINGSSNNYSDSLNGTDLGQAVVFAAFDNVTHTAGSGFTERSEVASGSGSNTSTGAVSTLDLTTTGAQNYSGTFSGSADWAVIAMAVLPADTAAPMVEIEYDYGPTTQPSMACLFFSSTTDEVQTVSILPDRSWSPSDLSSLTLRLRGGDIGLAACEVNVLYLEVLDSTGKTVVVSVTQLGGPA